VHPEDYLDSLDYQDYFTNLFSENLGGIDIEYYRIAENLKL